MLRPHVYRFPQRLQQQNLNQQRGDLIRMLARKGPFYLRVRSKREHEVLLVARRRSRQMYQLEAFRVILP